MKIANAQMHAYRIPFQSQVKTARGNFSHREGWLLEIEDHEGRHAVGDAAPWPGFGSSPEMVSACLRDLSANPQRLEPLLADSTADLSELPVECAYALDCIRLDLEGQRHEKTVAQILHDAPSQQVNIYALVHNAEQTKRALQQGFGHLKVKVGHQPMHEDMARLNDIREEAPNIPMHVDANGAWTLAEAHKAFEQLAPVKPAWIEEPLQGNDLRGSAILRKTHPIAIALDESISNQTDLDKIVDIGAADIVVIKPMFCGGLRSAHALARAAIAHDLQVVITHALESVVGRTGALHLAAALPENTSSAGLSAGFLADEKDGALCVEGALHVPDRPGLGVELTEKWRMQWT
jgi:o-succinylbenzoate synthase